MNTVKLYKNTGVYPNYANSLTEVQVFYDVTPRNQDIKSGFVDLSLDFATAMSCNYLSYERDGKLVYAFITDIQERSGDRLFRFSFSVDPLRTYKDKLILGAQYLVRTPTVTSLYDPLLGSQQQHPNITVNMHTLGNPDRRVMVVQHYVKDGSLIYSNVPLVPNPYRIYVCEFDPKKPLNATPIAGLITQMATGAKPENIVTMYSVPYFNIGGLPDAPSGLPVVQGLTTTFIPGWKYIPQDVSSYNIPNMLTVFSAFTYDNSSNISRRKHMMKLVIPDAGIMSIPDEYRFIPGIGLRQDVDLFSGASNYMLASDGGATPYDISLRGTAIQSIPIIADPEDTYLAQNLNSTASAMLGDVATAAAAGFAFAGPAGALGGAIGRGALSLASAAGNLADIGNKQVNPPAMLGSALVAQFNQRFWIIRTDYPVDNESLVHDEYGYPYNMINTLTIPTTGYIQTKECDIRSDGSVPKWALDEINNLFDNGIKFS